MAHGDVKGRIKSLAVSGDEWGIVNPRKTHLCIYMDELPLADENYRRVVIEETHPAFQSVLQMASLAFSGNKTVMLTYLKSQTVTPGAWDFGILEVFE